MDDGWMDGWMMDGRMNGGTDGQMDGGIDDGRVRATFSASTAALPSAAAWACGEDEILCYFIQNQGYHP
jgi:hypothetical protein